MKHKLVIGAISAAVILGGAVAAGAAQNPEAVIQKTGNKMISHDEAIKIALTKANGFVESVELENKNGKKYFDVEIEKGNKDFDIHIDAYTGKVLKMKENRDDDRDDDHDLDDNYDDDLDNDHDDFDHDDDSDDTFEKATKPSQTKFISEKQAIAIAEKKVNGKVKKIERDEDDGQFIYEMELRTSKGKVELDLDAVTGKVLDVEYDD